MTRQAITALQAESDRASELIASLTPEEWAAPSGCDGWRVQDVVQHMASTFQVIADPASIDGGSSQDAEENAEVPVQARKDWTPEQVATAYAEWAPKGIAALAGLQEPPMADMVVPLANLGSHPLHILGNAIVFDHYCHLRHDIGAALPRAADLARDHESLAATVDWMMAGVPQMCASALAGCEQGVNIAMTDIGQTWTVAPGQAMWAVSRGADASLPTATTTAHDFVSWGTKRADWRSMAVVAEGAAADTLDAINVI